MVGGPEEGVLSGRGLPARLLRCPVQPAVCGDLRHQPWGAVRGNLSFGGVARGPGRGEPGGAGGRGGGEAVGGGPVAGISSPEEIVARCVGAEAPLEGFYFTTVCW